MTIARASFNLPGKSATRFASPNRLVRGDRTGLLRPDIATSLVAVAPPPGENMNSTIKFRCPSCKVRIKAPVQLHGQIRPCPGCGNVFTVKPSTPEDSGPLLLFDDRTR